MFAQKPRLRRIAKQVVSSPWFRLVSAVGISPDRTVLGLLGLYGFFRDYASYRHATSASSSLAPNFRSVYPCLQDRYDTSGTASGHYFHQDLWVARKIHDATPAEHWDVGSRVDGFIAHLLAFRQVGFVDIRPLRSNLPGLTFRQGDVTNMPFENGSIESLSCLHVAEHVGLGRYGDRVDAEGHTKAMHELKRCLAPGGRLYFSVPIGTERVEFNAHRVLSPSTVLRAFEPLRLETFAAVDDTGDLVEGVSPDQFASANYACGLFVFRNAQV